MTFEHGISSLHIIESVGEVDGEPGRALHERLLKTPGQFSGLPIHVHKVLGESDLNSIMEAIFQGEASKGMTPILHFEVHGNNSEFCLRNGSRIPWIVFGQQLARFNLATRFNLLVVFSCCNGYQQIDALDAFRVCPFTALVSCVGTISTAELLDGFVAFYRTLATDRLITKAVRDMKAAIKSGTTAEFGLVSAARMFRSVVEAIYRENRDPEYLRDKKRELRRQAELKNALNGILTPISDADAERAFQESLDRTIRQHYTQFFALNEIPENAETFPFEDLVTNVRRRIEAGG